MPHFRAAHARAQTTMIELGPMQTFTELDQRPPCGLSRNWILTFNDRFARHSTAAKSGRFLLTWLCGLAARCAEQARDNCG